jgi:hypothetical protein
MTPLSAPIFAFGDAPKLPTEDSYTRPSQIDGVLAMTGPSIAADPGCLPVRGDLAHIKLAGKYFVPHYAAPMAYAIKSGAVLRAAARPDSDRLADLPAGETFNVLDMAGAWSWGQLGDDGLVGYVALDQLEALA